MFSMFVLILVNLACVDASVITTGFNSATKINTVMYDFDKTIVTNSYGGEILMSCDPNCNYTSCNCTGMDELTNHLLGLSDPLASVRDAFGGQDRLDRFQLHLNMVSPNAQLYIVSTSWYDVPGDEWAKFIYAALELVNLHSFFPMENILPLADLGQGISSDKGAVVESKLTDLNLHSSEAIFADDSEGNFLSSVQGSLSAETLYVQPRTGLSNEALLYIEDRVQTVSDDSSQRNQTITSTITRSLDDPMPISILMYDFDKTIITSSYGGEILMTCDPNCNYTSCDCIGVDELKNHLSGLSDPLASVLDAFGGQERLDRFADHLATVSTDAQLYIVSTSWYTVPADEWAKFIYAALELVNLHSYFPMENILPLADLGQGISSDKGAVVENKLTELNLLSSDAIFADDSQGNFLSTVQGGLDAETLYVQPRTGLSNEALNYIEHRVKRPDMTEAPVDDMTDAPVDDMTDAPEMTDAPVDTVTEAPDMTDAPVDTVTEAPDMTDAPVDDMTDAPVNDMTDAAPVTYTISGSMDLGYPAALTDGEIKTEETNVETTLQEAYGSPASCTMTAAPVRRRLLDVVYNAAFTVPGVSKEAADTDKSMMLADGVKARSSFNLTVTVNKITSAETELPSASPTADTSSAQHYSVSLGYLAMLMTLLIHW